jgi:glycosyltransferase involved in cell wall biosynthesis
MADRISVIVPVYNVAADLPRCLDSILAQTYHDIEILAVDDGSQDSSGNILDHYADAHLNIRVIHKENGGVTSARLAGIAAATGDWIGFVDGDDEIEPDMYARLLKNAQEYGAQISHCGYQMCFADGRVHYFHNTGFLAKHDKVAALKELLSGAMIEPGLWNKLFHKSLFHSFSLGEVIPLDIKINEDLLMNFYLFSAAEQSIFDDWCPYHYIVREGSATRTKINNHKIYDPIRVKDIIRKHVSNNILPDAQRAYINTCINSYHTLLLAGAEYRSDLKAVRSLLSLEKRSFSLLRRKRKMMAHLIIGAPSLYRPIYRFYCRYFQKKVYS